MSFDQEAWDKCEADHKRGRLHNTVVGKVCWCCPGYYYPEKVAYKKPQGRYFFYETPWPEDYKITHSRSVKCENPIFPPQELMQALLNHAIDSGVYLYPGKILDLANEVIGETWGCRIDEKLVELRRRFSRSQSAATVDLIEEIMEMRTKQRTREGL